MGACLSSGKGGGGGTGAENVAERQRSHAIDKKIEEDAKRLSKECKILLLGAGESGKSTIVKQMKIIHQNGYTEEELRSYRSTVYKNLLECAACLLKALRELDVELASQKARDGVDFLAAYQQDPDPNTPIDPAVGDAIALLWSDPNVARVTEQQNEFYILDSAPYFFSEVSRICAPDYVPNEADVLRARTKTTGIYDTRFNMGQLNIHMFDVGGQRSERKKWIHCFENVTSIIFCVALSEYDQVLLEENSQNRMNESLILFDSVVNSRWFMRTSIVLFLNKVDLFRAKIDRSPLGKYFPEYSGGNDPNRAAKFLLWKFTQVNRAHLTLYPHLTQATDTSNIRLVFSVVKETILQNALRDSGIL
ncbi:Guanine nucleotide-binding protein alpha-2 subunit [Ascosphaera acerosa]|nr:Guanine nucleotide-binding protein alpha-2 subunit [Ascosphaera acerosa]